MYDLTYMWNLKYKQTKNRTHAENRLVVARGGGCAVGEMSETGQKVQTSSYKCHGNVMSNMVTTFNNTILHT